MTKLYGPDEGYETVLRHGTAKKLKKDGKVRQSAQSNRVKVRKQITDLISDRDPDGSVLKGPPFPAVIDLHRLTDVELVKQASKVITTTNPAGRPPPGVQGPTMQSLIDRLQVSQDEDPRSYASVARSTPSVSASPLPSPLPSDNSYHGSVLTEDRSSYAESEVPSPLILLKATSPKKGVSSSKRSPGKVKKVTRKSKVTFAIPSPLEMEVKKKVVAAVQRGSQYATETVRSQEISRPPGSRNIINTKRLGKFFIGKQDIATSKENKKTAPKHVIAHDIDINTVTIDFDRVIDSEESDSSDDSSDNPRENYDSQDGADTPTALRVNKELVRHKSIPSLKTNDFTTLHVRPTDETDVSDSSSEDSSISRPQDHQGSSSTPPHLTFTKTDLQYLQDGCDSEQFTTKVAPVEKMSGAIYIPPPEHVHSIMASNVLDEGEDPTTIVIDGTHILTPAERDFCQSQQSRWALLYIIAKDLHKAPKVKDFAKEILAWPSTMHTHLVVLAGAFTNTVWPLNNTYRQDKLKFGLVLSRHACNEYESLFAKFSNVPLSVLRIEYLLLLPIAAIIGYIGQLQKDSMVLHEYIRRYPYNA